MSGTVRIEVNAELIEIYDDGDALVELDGKEILVNAYDWRYLNTGTD